VLLPVEEWTGISSDRRRAFALDAATGVNVVRGLTAALVSGVPP